MLGPRCLTWTVIGVLAGGSACRTREGYVPPASPAEALSRIQAAIRADNLGEVWKLLDKKTQWSLMSVHKDQRKTCELVRASYPKERQVRELRRCRAAEVAADTKAFFVALARAHRDEILGPVARFKAPGKTVEQEGEARLSDGQRQLAFCKEDRGWTYCGLREHAEQLKLKAVRDRATVRENIEAFK
jgi:hypothetical protein